MGILLIFGAVVYLLVSVVLINHIDDQLEATVNDIVNVTRVNPVGDTQCDQVPLSGYDRQRLCANLGAKRQADGLLTKSFTIQRIARP